MAGKAGDLAHHIHKDVLPLAPRAHCHIAQTLAGQAQALGVGEAGQGVGVERRRVRHGLAVKHDVPVGLVTDQKDIVSVPGAFFGQNRRHAGQGIGRVDHAGGVVGGVDEHTGDLFGQHLCKGIQIGLESGCLRGHHPQHRAGARHIGAVLREVRCKGQHLVPGLGHRPDGMGDSTRRAGGGEDVLLRVGQAEGLGQMLRHSGAEARVALTGAIAVQAYRLFLCQQGLHGFGKLRRAGHAGVAQ